MTQNDLMREAFERDALAQGLDLTIIKIMNGVHGYRDPKTQYFWMGYRKSWQAATQSALEAAAKVADRFTCGGCGMDGKCSAAIRGLAAGVPKAGA